MRIGPMYLFSTAEEELIGVNAVDNCTTEEGNPVEYHRRLTGVLEKQLVENINYNGKDTKSSEAGRNRDGGRSVGQLLIERPSNSG